MQGRRVVVSVVSAAIVALVLSACGTAPPATPPVLTTSPYHGTSTVWSDPLTGFGQQQARVQVCSPAGGPIVVDVHSPDVDATTELRVSAISTDYATTGDLAAAILIDEEFPKPTAPVDAHAESIRSMRPGECADVTVVSRRNIFSAGPAFTYTVTW
jgi:hypothetical protein